MDHPTPRSPRRRRRLLAALVVTVAFVAPGAVADASGSGGSQPSSLAEARRQREQVRQQRARKASEIKVLQATIAELEDALDALEANVKTQAALLADAQRAAEAAEAQVAAATQLQQAKQAELQALDRDLKRLALQAYVNPPADGALLVLNATDVGAAVRRQALLSFRAGRVADVIDRAAQVEEDLALARRQAEAAAAEALARRAEEQQRLGQLKEAQEQQERVAAEAEDRLDRALAEADALAQIDKRLADQIGREQAALAARLARQRASASRATARSPVGNITVVNVGGIIVNVQIADNVARLLEAARADGLVLTGGGYRDSSSQVALRRSNCGTSEYAIYSMPPSQCRPPTARPGSSMHERGLAIDFMCNGAVISSRSSPCYRWLAQNASRFGLYNLPSEPWHWSTNGQ